MSQSANPNDTSHMSALPGPPPKLRPGQLRRQVLGILATNRSDDWTVTEVTARLGGRSSGAVGNALQSLTRTGHAIQSGVSPRRYRVTPAGVTTYHNGDATPAHRGTSPARPSSAVTAGQPPRPGAVQRPNGEWYLPRELADGLDIDVLRKARRNQIPILLYGPPGTGKTSLVEAAFGDLVTIAGHGDTCIDDLLGTYTPTTGGGFTFDYGPLVVAMREGRALLVDDATLIPPKVLAVLYPAMDGRGTITIPAHHNETVTAAPGFYVIAGHNPGVHGAILTEALASRFQLHIEVTTDFDLARTLGVPTEAVTAAANLNNRLRHGDIDWAPQLRELLAFKRIAATLGTRAAVSNLAAIAPESDRDTVITVLAAAFGYTPALLTIGEQA